MPSSPTTGLFGIVCLDSHRLEPQQLAGLTPPGFPAPVVRTETAALFADGWAGTYQAPGGLSVAGAAHLLSRESLPAGLQQAPALEVVAELYRAEGIDAFARLDGQLCLAVCDPGAGRVIVVADRFATRSVYFTEQKGLLLFGTRLAFLPAGCKATIDPRAILEYLLYTTIPSPRTPFAGVSKLQAGHVLIAAASGVRRVGYWDMSYPEERNGRPVADWARDLRREIEAAVRRHVTAEPSPEQLGAFLSGGTDSSTVAGMIMRVTGTPVKAFSIGYSDRDYDELSYARLAAGWFGAVQYEHCLSPAEALELLPAIARYYEEPFGNASAIGTYACARMAREAGVSVLFAGDGGDELFGGNERYRTDKIFGLYQHVPAPLRRYLTDPLLSALPEGVPILGQARRYARRSNIPNPRRMFSYNLLIAEPLSHVLSADFLAAIDQSQLLATVEEHFHRPAAGTAELNRLLYLDLKLAIADNDVRKVSGMTELAGIEVRYPLLDTRLAQLSGRIPASLKLHRLQKRFLFKQALADFLPPAILKKPKHGFGVPVAFWMRDEPRWRAFVSDILHDPRTRQRGYFRPEVLESMQRAHDNDGTSFYGEHMWGVVMLELWAREAGW